MCVCVCVCVLPVAQITMFVEEQASKPAEAAKVVSDMDLEEGELPFDPNAPIDVTQLPYILTSTLNAFRCVQCRVALDVVGVDAFIADSCTQGCLAS